MTENYKITETITSKAAPSTTWRVESLDGDTKYRVSYHKHMRSLSIFSEPHKGYPIQTGFNCDEQGKASLALLDVKDGKKPNGQSIVSQGRIADAVLENNQQICEAVHGFLNCPVLGSFLNNLEITTSAGAVKPVFHYSGVAEKIAAVKNKNQVIN